MSCCSAGGQCFVKLKANNYAKVAGRLYNCYKKWYHNSRPCRVSTATSFPTTMTSTICSYLPEVVDHNCKESKACFLPNESRSHLLLDKVFYFLTEKQVRETDSRLCRLYYYLQYNRLCQCITNGGGRCYLATSRESINELEELVNDNAVVMSVDGNTLSSLDHNKKEWVQQVLSFIKRYL